MFDLPFTVILLIALSLAFDFLNGFHDSSNIVATMIASRALTGRQALTITAIAEFAGPFLFGVAVATTIGNEVLNDVALKLSVVMSALVAAVIWNLLTWYLGIPSSSSHALIGGLLGAAIIENGFGVVKMAGLWKVLIALAISPILGFTIGYLVMKIVLFLARPFPPNINSYGGFTRFVARHERRTENDGRDYLGLGLFRSVEGISRTAVGHLHQRNRDCLWHLDRWLAVDSNARRQILQDSPDSWLHRANHIGKCDFGRSIIGWSRQHDPGCEFSDYGCWFSRARFQGALGRGGTNRDDVAHDDSGVSSDGGFGCVGLGTVVLSGNPLPAFKTCLEARQVF